MRFIPLTDGDKKEMLAAIGVPDIDTLFADIPKGARIDHRLTIPEAYAEQELFDHMEELGDANQTVHPSRMFVGAGCYPHYTPAAVDQMLLRSELFTAYTPYQPEISQGTLMAIHEFQTYVAALTGMDIANASMYDGASALAEGVIMATRIGRGKKNKIVLSNLVHPHWREVTRTYTQHLGIELVDVDGTKGGMTPYESLAKVTDETTAALVVSYPTFMGTIEDLAAIRRLCDETKALMIVCVPEPVALGVLKSPGAFGADIVVGEGASFGGALNYGGPGVGMFATKDAHARQMPGRLVGKTKDADGKEGYVLTLATREQHIRRERATSNICSNQALCATAAAIHLSLLGKMGLRRLSMKNASATRYLLEKVSALKGFNPVYPAIPFFNEVVIETPVEPEVITRSLAKEGIVAGMPLTKYAPSLPPSMLFCATDVHSKDSIDRLADALARFER